MDTPIQELRNLGPKSAAWIQAVGIDTVEAMRQIGPLVAYQLVKEKFPTAYRNLLWALVAGLQDQDWRDLNAAEKARIEREVAELNPVD